ncbi:hypothetical protein ATJ88_2872 [Isoptericola jiangsuensis]|uniref:Uncharacterized protein n=1 Tax=Isoptericola jiangsuensis TaxID=548579 RepID=A0A2A9EYL2_9MICO|nr:hypothetical protein [Isoptericola jiangsuensis]PFG44154.1 hypothetical protein ATJ88_2872 [Isoptericola jiangsuensis]
MSAPALQVQAFAAAVVAAREAEHDRAERAALGESLTAEDHADVAASARRPRWS